MCMRVHGRIRPVSRVVFNCIIPHSLFTRHLSCGHIYLILGTCFSLALFSMYLQSFTSFRWEIYSSNFSVISKIDGYEGREPVDLVNITKLISSAPTKVMRWIIPFSFRCLLTHFNKHIFSYFRTSDSRSFERVGVSCLRERFLFGTHGQTQLKFLDYIMNFSPFSFQLMIDLSLSTPIQDASVYQFPLNLVSQLLQEVGKQEIKMTFGQSCFSKRHPTTKKGSVCLGREEGLHGGGRPPTPEIWSTGGRCASYWNAFLLLKFPNNH